MIAIPTGFVADGAVRFARLRPLAVRISTAVLLVLAGAMAIDTIATVVRLHSALPYFDQWDDLDLLRSVLRGRTSLFDGLIAQNNEHRIAFPRLVLFSDYLAFGGRGLFDAAVILGIQLAQATMLIALLRRALPRGDRGFLPLAAITAMLLSSLRQEENFSWDFQVQFVAIFALATATVLLFAAALARMRRGAGALGWLIGAYASAFVATFTMANGLIAALVLVLLAAIGRAGWRLVAASLLVVAILAGLYLHGYKPQAAHTPVSQSLRHPLGVLSFTATYLGNFLYPDASWSRLLGLCGLAGLGASAIQTWRSRGEPAVRLALLGIMLFTAGTAAMTALGRLGFGLDQAMSSRYATGSAAFWSALLAYGWSASAGMSRRVALRGACAAGALLLVAGAVHSQRLMKTDADERADAQALTTDGLLLGLRDAGTFGGVDDATDVIVDLSGFLKERGWSIFDEPDAHLVGRPLAEAGVPGDAASCQGEIAGALAMPSFGADAVMVSGVAAPLHDERLAGRIYLAGPDGGILGFASELRTGAPPGTWKGYAVAPPGTVLHAFVRLWGGALCPVGEHVVDTPLPSAP